jgi:hypothetical protein
MTKRTSILFGFIAPEIFASIFMADQRINQIAREDTISIYILRGARADVNKRLKDEAERKKN